MYSFQMKCARLRVRRERKRKKERGSFGDQRHSCIPNIKVNTRYPHTTYLLKCISN